MKFEFTTIKSRLIFWFLLVALVPLFVATLVISLERSQVIKETIFHKLIAIRDLKVEMLNNWIDEQISDTLILSKVAQINGASKILIQKNHSAQEGLIIESAANFLIHYRNQYKSYEEIYVVNPDTKKIEISTNPLWLGMDESLNPAFTTPITSGHIHIRDIYYSPKSKHPTMSFSIPIFSTGDQRKIIGILVAHINLENSLYDLLLDRTGMGKTGETLIINKAGMALNELRWYPGAPLKLKIDAKPAQMAAQGKTGITEADDYRKEAVLAAFTHIPRTQWGFVAKQDLKEVYAPVKEMLWHIFVIVLISSLAVYVVALFLSRNIASPLMEIREVAKKILSGDLLARNKIQTRDELGFLADTFNKMAASTASHIHIQESMVKINTFMVTLKTLDDFFSKLPPVLLEETSAGMAAFFILSRDGKTYEKRSTLGVNPDLLIHLDAGANKGEIGLAGASKKITRIRDIPESTLFKFKTFTGDILPKEIIVVPILVKNRVKALLTMASLNLYSKEALKIIHMIWPSINTAYSNLIASEKTARLAEEMGLKNIELEQQSTEMEAQATQLKCASEELKHQNTALEQQQKQLKNADRLKSEFLSNMSHELRTPLNSVMALSRVLIMQAKKKLSREEVNYLEIIEKNGKHLLSLINDILDLSKIEAGKMDVTPKPFSLNNLVETIVESLTPLAKEKGIKINHNIDHTLKTIESDELRVHQIIQNIVGNGVKFTSKGNVAIDLSHDETNAYIRVRDTGVGISQKDLPYIFEEFRQIDGSSSRKFEGTGLGLTIAYKAAQILRGDIDLTSQLNQGSEFTVRLPILWEGYIPSEPASIGFVKDNTPLRKKTILVVDDDPGIRDMISEFLTNMGYQTLTAASGKQALDLARAHNPMAMTIDIIMPEMDGWELISRLKNDPRTSQIPVIVVSITNDRETGFALGSMGHIAKPVDKDKLIAKIRKLDTRTRLNVLIADDNEMR